MTLYETMFITVPTLADDEAKTIIEMVGNTITEGGGSIVFEDPMGRRRLAYPIHKHEDGIFHRYLYEAAGTVPAEIERRSRLSDKIMRSMTIKLEKADATRAREQAEAERVRRIEEAERAVAEAEAEAEAAAKAEAEAAAAPAEDAASDAEASTEATDGDSKPAAAAAEAPAPAAEAAAPSESTDSDSSAS